MTSITMTRFRKADGPLTKRIRLDPDGRIISDGSACLMTAGVAERVQLGGIAELGAMIERLGVDEALALGSLRPGLPDRVDVITKRKLAEINGVPRPDLIARTGGTIRYEPQQPAYALFDYDTKGMPAEVATQLGGNFWRTIVGIVPALAGAARLRRASTSAGLYRSDTGFKFAGSNGLHIYVAVHDGTDIERFLTDLHRRCWLAGFGWMMVAAGGQLLERSIIDRMVGAPERLVFEGSPVLDPPLAQDPDSRRPEVREGEPLDTLAACPPLTVVELNRFRELRAKEAQRLKPEAQRARKTFIAAQAKRLADRTGLSHEVAEKIIDQQCNGVLLPHVELPFDDDDLAGATVANVLADPERFADATLADPLEGPDYGRGKAKIMLRADGTPWIHSFAHGRTIFQLRYDADVVRKAIENAPKEKVIQVFVRYMLNAELDATETAELLDLAAKRTGLGKRAIAQTLKAAHEERGRRVAGEEDERKTAARRDPRPRLPVPDADEPFIPQMQVLNEVLGASRAAEPPMRDPDGYIVQVRVRRMPGMHELTSAGVNYGNMGNSSLPPPEQPLLTRLSEAQVAELIERHIEYVDPTERPVHLPGPFVSHFRHRDDDVLPIATSIATLPVVLPDRTFLADRGLHRKLGTVFRVPDELIALLPKPKDCTPIVVAGAMRFLTDEWLCDVATDYRGKCILIAAALSIIERFLFPSRPVFFISAGRSGSGKTTVLIMLLMAVTGIRPAAAAWSPDDEERRKALMGYLMQAVPAIIWDNILRGSRITCPHIEKACTSEYYSDRQLGVSEIVSALATAIHLFTGNNIGPKGDLARRALQARLEVDRADPENRAFTHPDPIGWTSANRGRLLASLYTILLGNPVIQPGSNIVPQTGFPEWWRLVGSAVEHAAHQHTDHVAARTMNALRDCVPCVFSFRDLFIAQKQEDEESADLGEVLEALDEEWPKETKFRAAQGWEMSERTSRGLPVASARGNLVGS